MARTDNKAPDKDERIKEVSALRRAMIRPELGAIAGAVLVFMFFLGVARDTGMFGPEGIINWGTVSAQFAIIAVGACLLMIAGEFDLSVGSMIGFAGIVVAVTSVSWGWPVWLSILTAFALAMAIGGLNGYLVIKTGLPSFIVTLAFLYILRGLTIYGAITTTGKTIIGGVKDVAEGDWLAPLFSGKVLGWLFEIFADWGWVDKFTVGPRAGEPVVDGIPMLMVWAFILIVFAHYLLTRTKFGNWIFAAGGNPQAAKYVGVPVDRVKILMFVCSPLFVRQFSLCARLWNLVQQLPTVVFLKEFEAIISVVIGGALLTGGYGSVIGAALGALIFGVVQQGLYFWGVDSSLFRVFLGVILLMAVILNTYIRRIITGER